MGWCLSFTPMAKGPQDAAPGDVPVVRSLLSPQVPVLDGVGAVPPHRALAPGRHRADGAGQRQHQLAQRDFRGLRGTVSISTSPKGPCGHLLLLAGTWSLSSELREGCPGWSEPQDILPEVQRVLPPGQLGCSPIPTGREAVLVRRPDRQDRTDRPGDGREPGGRPVQQQHGHVLRVGLRGIHLLERQVRCQGGWGLCGGRGEPVGAVARWGRVLCWSLGDSVLLQDSCQRLHQKRQQGQRHRVGVAADRDRRAAQGHQSLQPGPAEG